MHSRVEYPHGYPHNPRTKSRPIKSARICDQSVSQLAASFQASQSSVRENSQAGPPKTISTQRTSPRSRLDNAAYPDCHRQCFVFASLTPRDSAICSVKISATAFSTFLLRMVSSGITCSSNTVSLWVVNAASTPHAGSCLNYDAFFLFTPTPIFTPQNEQKQKTKKKKKKKKGTTQQLVRHRSKDRNVTRNNENKKIKKK
jgi:hypothetical protein